MATYTAAYADIRINDNARFRTQGQFISDTLETMGWTKTADTGQINWASVTAPAAADTIQGYEIRSNGTLYFKIQYGSGYAAYAKSLWFQFGFGSDGAGAITTPMSAAIQTRSAIGYSGASAKAGDDYLSGDSTRFMIALTEDTTSTYCTECSLEATSDFDGNADGLGWHFTRAGYNITSDSLLISKQYGVVEVPSYVRLPRAIGSAGVYVPISNALVSHPVNSISVLRDTIMAPTSLVAHQATLSVNGRTYLSGYGNTNNAGVFGFTPAYNCSVLMRYD